MRMRHNWLTLGAVILAIVLGRAKLGRLIR